MKQPKPQASIVIPTKDKLSRLKLTLQALAPQVTGGAAEVIVVCDGCKPEVTEELRRIEFGFAPVLVVLEQGGGRSAARNAGIRRAAADIVIMLDDDRVPAPDFVRKHVDGQRGGDCALLGERADALLTEGEIERLYEDERPVFGELLRRRTDGEFHKPLPVSPGGRLGWLLFYTGNVSVRKEHLLKAGCFDENFVGWGHEDLDLGIRLSRLGLAFVRDSSIRALHLLHDSSFDVAERTRQSHVNMVYMLGKYKYSLPYWVLKAMHWKHRLVGLSMNRKVRRIEG